jgi:outer membrane biosynthesis protein TonB
MPGLPEWLDQAVLRALEKSPDARFQTVDEMRTFLLSRLAAEPPAPIEDTAEELPTMILPPRPATVASERTVTRAAPPPASPATMETDRPRVTVPPPPPPPPPAPAPVAAAGTSYRPVGESGKKGWAIAAAAVLVVILAGVFAWTRSSTETAAVPPPDPATAPSTDPAAVPAETMAEASTAPATLPTDAPAGEPAPVEKTATYQPPPRPIVSPRPETSRPEPAAPEPAPAAEPEPSHQEEPAASEAPADDELPLEELRRLAGELVPASEKLGEVYDEFLEKKEDGGAEITDSDEQLQEEIEGLTDAASGFNKRFREGIFARTRDRIRKTDQRFEMIRRGRELGAAIGRVEKLMGTVQPGPEVRQQWQEVRRRWERVAVVVGVR